ncbi:hypothetical protein Btru_035326 [Bulinus truncatus]|nr:hypothetical protein Btru_035326 [Bulinus truncatus]
MCKVTFRIHRCVYPDNSAPAGSKPSTTAVYPEVRPLFFPIIYISGPSLVSRCEPENMNLYDCSDRECYMGGQGVVSKLGRCLEWVQNEVQEMTYDVVVSVLLKRSTALFVFPVSHSGLSQTSVEVYDSPFNYRDMTDRVGLCRRGSTGADILVRCPPLPIHDPVQPGVLLRTVLGKLGHFGSTTTDHQHASLHLNSSDLTHNY